ncbi:hypothetical protein TKK_0015756 [Trichogramma kaykai]
MAPEALRLITRTLRCRGPGGCEPRSATTAWWSARRLPRRPFTIVKVSSLAEALLLASTTCSCSCGWGPVARFAAAATLRVAFSLSRTVWMQPPRPASRRALPSTPLIAVVLRTPE